jgi:Gluconate 2-dehydrogenase subunit 3
MEGAAVEALMDRLIPPDPDTPGGKDTGCAVFIDRQLAGALAAALAALGQYRLQAMDNQAKTIQTKRASANAGTKQQTRVSP